MLNAALKLTPTAKYLARFGIGFFNKIKLYENEADF